MAGHGFGRYGLLPGHAIAASDRLEQIQHGLQFRLRLPLQHPDHVRSGVCRLCQCCTNGSLKLPGQLQCHRGNRSIHGHHRQAAQPLHRRLTGGVLECEALQQSAALRGMHKESQGPALSASAGCCSARLNDCNGGWQGPALLLAATP
jgi:hypothetical protein